MSPERNFVRLALLLSLVYLVSCRQQKEIVFTHSQVLTVNKESGTDPAMDSLLKPYQDSLKKTMDKVIGISPMSYSKAEPQGELGNLLCDLMLDYSSLNSLDIDIALMNNGGIRSELPAGNITLRNIYEIMPFDNEVTILTLNKKQLFQLFERIAMEADMSIGGVTIETQGNKFLRYKWLNNDVKQDSFFSVITSDYIADGGDHMSFLGSAMQRRDMNILLRDLFIQMIEYRTINNLPLKPQPYVRVKTN